MNRKIKAVEVYSSKAREMVRLAKRRDADAIRTMARQMADLVKDGSVLVPVPSHTGHASYILPLLLAIKVQKGGNVSICTCIEGKRRASQYATKMAGGLLKGEDFGFRLSRPVPEGNLVVVDDVIGTGETMKAVMKLLPKANVVVFTVDIEKQKLTKKKSL